MGFLIYVNMQQRGDGKVYADMHKTDGRIYFTRQEAQAAIDSDLEMAKHRHVVPIICNVYEPQEGEE